MRIAFMSWVQSYTVVIQVEFRACSRRHTADYEFSEPGRQSDQKYVEKGGERFSPTGATGRKDGSWLSQRKHVLSQVLPDPQMLMIREELGGGWKLTGEQVVEIFWLTLNPLYGEYDTGNSTRGNIYFIARVHNLQACSYHSGHFTEQKLYI